MQADSGSSCQTSVAVLFNMAPTVEHRCPIVSCNVAETSATLVPHIFEGEICIFSILTIFGEAAEILT